MPKRRTSFDDNWLTDCRFILCQLSIWI